MTAQKASDAHRDPRLDFFRGLGMFIILIAHTPWNGWNAWIPARFGYSDATEIFVFCSGAASAIAFMKVFEARGWGLGAARVSYRIWQIYWCHIGVFLAVTMAVVSLDAWLENGGFYLASLGLPPLSRYGDEQIYGLLTLAYVPNLFDILPMYLVILALMPIVAALALESRMAAIAFIIALYLAASQPWIAVIGGSTPLFRITLTIAAALAIGGLLATAARSAGLGRRGVIGAIAIGAALLALSPLLWPAIPALDSLGHLNLSARPWDDSIWFFNPFAWQLIFFTGFAFATGWIPAPPIDKRLMWAAAAVLIVSFPLDPDGTPAFRLLRAFEFLEPVRAALREIRADLAPISSKTFFGVLRYIHFLALAYLVWALAGDRGANLPQTGIGARIVTIVRRVGQQSLAVFVASLVIARLLGAVIRETADAPAANTAVEGAFRATRADADFWATLFVNLLGFALLIGVAYLARFYRRQPWRPKSS